MLFIGITPNKQIILSEFTKKQCAFYRNLNINLNLCMHKHKDNL